MKTNNSYSIAVVWISATVPVKIENHSGVFHLTIARTSTDLDAHAGLTRFRGPVDGQQTSQKNKSDHLECCRMSEWPTFSMDIYTSYRPIRSFEFEYMLVRSNIIQIFYNDYKVYLVIKRSTCTARSLITHSNSQRACKRNHHLIKYPKKLNIRKIWWCLMSTCLFARTNGTKPLQRSLYSNGYYTQTCTQTYTKR